MLGSNNTGKTWVTLDVRTNQIFQARQERKLYKIRNETAFSTYRLESDRGCGVGVTARDNQGRIQGIRLLIPSLEYVDVITPPPNPATMPVRKTGSLLGLSGPWESFHRVKVEGVVTLQQNQRVFVHSNTGNAMAILKEIADVLQVNIETIRKHCHNIYERLQVSSRTEAVVKYLGR